MTFVVIPDEWRETVTQHSVAPVQKSSIDSAQSARKREGAGIGVFLTLTEPSKPMVVEAAGAGEYTLPGFAPVPRIQIVTIAQAMALRDRAVRLPARRDDGFRRAAKEPDRGAQGALEF